MKLTHNTRLFVGGVHLSARQLVPHAVFNDMEAMLKCMICVLDGDNSSHTPVWLFVSSSTGSLSES